MLSSQTGADTTLAGPPGPAWLERHWLLAANALNGLVIGGAVLAPWLRASGWEPLATLLYLAYRSLCLQRPSHSFFLFGHQLALEHRMLAIALGLLLGGLLFALLRDRLRPLDRRLLVLLNLPMLLDVLSQTIGLRDSTWPWRVGTGLLGSLAAVWWAYPHLGRAFATAAVSRPAVASGATPAEQARAIVTREALKEQR